MKAVEYFRWMLIDERTGKRKRSRWSMPRAEALKVDPGATPIEGTREIRMLPETQEEVAAAMMSNLGKNVGH